MKHIFLSLVLLTGFSFSYAGNGNGGGNPPCNCNSLDEVDLYASGTAVIIGGNSVYCEGDAGVCWEVVFKPGGGWTFTIFTHPPVSFGNSNGPENPPANPVLKEETTAYSLYEWDTRVWK